MKFEHPWIYIAAGTAVAAGLMAVLSEPEKYPVEESIHPEPVQATGTESEAIAQSTPAPATTDDLFAAALEMTNALERSHRLEDLGAQLAGQNSNSAFFELGKLTEKMDRAAFIRGMFWQFAQGDTRQALAEAKRIPNGPEHETALTTLMEQWKGGSLSAPDIRAADIQNFGFDAGLGMELLKGDHANPELAALWAVNLASGKGRTGLLAAAVAQMMPSDPASVNFYAGQLPAAEQGPFLSQMAADWAESDPRAAWQWSALIPDAATRAAAEKAAFTTWASADPMGAAAVLGELRAEDRQSAIQQVAAGMAMKDTDAAFNWANQFTQVGERELALTAIRQTVPTGIGALVGTQGGYPIINAVTPGSPAERSGQIQPGDRLVAVAQADGQFVNVNGMNVQQIVAMIRGTAGTPVSVQVTRNGTTITVPLVRDQIRLKNM